MKASRPVSVSSFAHTPPLVFSAGRSAPGAVHTNGEAAAGGMWRRRVPAQLPVGDGGGALPDEGVRGVLHNTQLHGDPDLAQAGVGDCHGRKALPDREHALSAADPRHRRPARPAPGQARRAGRAASARWARAGGGGAQKGRGRRGDVGAGSAPLGSLLLSAQFGARASAQALGWKGR